MLKLSYKIVEEIKASKDITVLQKYLQSAIELEHATIPPYLTGLYSIKLNSNKEAANIILSVVRQEMLHMTIAANVLNAIGGHPVINKPGFIPTYPGPLPMNVVDGLIVNLQSLSKDVLKNTFMEIEKPEDPIEFPVKANLEVLKTQQFATIGQFYQAIIDKLEEFGPSCITGDSHRQVVNSQWFPPDQLFAISKLDDATRALTLIVQQGEGTSKSPLDPEGDLAHYYRFAEIFYGKRLVKDPSNPKGYSYSGELIPLEENNIWNLPENSKAKNYQPGTKARRLVDQFNYTYTSLLNGLHKTFNGEPSYLNTVMGLMFELKLQAQEMVEITDPYSNQQVAPSFEYQPNNV